MNAVCLCNAGLRWMRGSVATTDTVAWPANQIKPETRRFVYCTNVSVNTKVSLTQLLVAKESAHFAMHPRSWPSDDDPRLAV